MACWSAENATKAYLRTLKMGKRNKQPDVAEFVSALAAGNSAQLMVDVCSGIAGATTLALFVIGNAESLLTNYYKGADFVLIDCKLDGHESVFRAGLLVTRIPATNKGEDTREVSSRLSQMQQLIQEAEELASSARNEPTPTITLDHVSVSFARSSGPGGQNVNKVNTKVDMRFNVKKAYWLSERIRERILQLEKNRINKDGEIVIASTKTRTQKGNIEDALAKLQAIIDAAAYVPPPPSEEQKKKLAKMAAVGEQKRLQSKKALSQKKVFRRTRDRYD
ncbi:Peptidyl-trna hydrolase ict1 protein [Thalictrum thalictroides]|uniref:Peptidyl-trna hydrolase ict1 protein n=1 Tax=Thalictrum thalictroides TaxID=46969 RepID=A0A7J6XEI1_THATH|nr:Peptidyl-trna hydrolase ict1 protein [Thalictrum thalictroides]